MAEGRDKARFGPSCDFSPKSPNSTCRSNGPVEPLRALDPESRQAAHRSDRCVHLFLGVHPARPEACEFHCVRRDTRANPVTSDMRWTTWSVGGRSARRCAAAGRAVGSDAGLARGRVAPWWALAIPVLILALFVPGTPRTALDIGVPSPSPRCSEHYSRAVGAAAKEHLAAGARTQGWC